MLWQLSVTLLSLHLSILIMQLTILFQAGWIFMKLTFRSFYANVWFQIASYKLTSLIQLLWELISPFSSVSPLTVQPRFTPSAEKRMTKKEVASILDKGRKGNYIREFWSRHRICRALRNTVAVLHMSTRGRHRSTLPDSPPHACRRSHVIPTAEGHPDQSQSWWRIPRTDVKCKPW